MGIAKAQQRVRRSYSTIKLFDLEKPPLRTMNPTRGFIVTLGGCDSMCRDGLLSKELGIVDVEKVWSHSDNVIEPEVARERQWP